ncbi:MAG: hypothetical protein ACFCU9_13020, partial [Cyanophyceae cyanobacterium]
AQRLSAIKGNSRRSLGSLLNKAQRTLLQASSPILPQIRQKCSRPANCKPLKRTPSKGTSHLQAPQPIHDPPGSLPGQPFSLMVCV